MSDTFRKNYNSIHLLHCYEKKVKEIAEDLAKNYTDVGQSREMSLALTNLEQSIMWFTKALYTPENKDKK
ncbi:hypothetical protein UFOVP855_36 [uncultured Caudovirales phage]|jgi:hypothetical protein|uniref:Acb2/Tad1 hairpin domain-containing protein n=1 Tax=uncultured Caudovirales phage TaxID=2100421 RepID=A0A6J5PRH0_9CAUD|nr:hypothetical protein UFOVP527_13 [uncultured Caudovirales phage]CAB4167646.1 hypothetical protein UFOVP855_36 [uncultured Caudovirales phage]CAB4173597.1 hypothetical protein UFOVP954_38 [uncultured Caudovirales phage]CAB4179027.1 hypothetical protein UFOVP1026_23 [uncultured Caudovirales phage]CAB4188280.1 hypothetical protein UFOVP1180_7 [uncultured Caudovirales phage]